MRAFHNPVVMKRESSKKEKLSISKHIYCRFTNFVFLLDDFVVTTDQQANLKFLVRLGKSILEALCMLQHVYKEQSLSCSTVFLCHKRFKAGRLDVENDPKCGTILVPSLCISRSFVIICQMLFRFNLNSFEISRTLNRPSPRTIFFTSLTLVIISTCGREFRSTSLFVEVCGSFVEVSFYFFTYILFISTFLLTLLHLGSSSTSPRLSLNFLCQRKTVERDKVCSL